MALESHPIDGSLVSWQEVTSEYDEWAGLLLGNGLSRNVCRDFGYPSLFEKARRDEAPGSLTGADRDLFAILDTQNFERVLAELAAAIRMAEALDEDPRPFLERYQSIQHALGRAVQSVHVGYYDIPKASLKAIGQVLQGQKYVFTTSYDLDH